MNEVDVQPGEWEQRNRSNTLRVMRWTGAWVVTIGLAAFGPRFFWDFNHLITIPVLLLSLGAGLGMILACVGQIKNMDEMQRMLFLESAAITLGGGLVLGSTYELLEDIHLISYQPEISHLIIIMCLTFMCAKIAGQRRYQ